MNASFAEARRLSPSVLIIDEIDAVGSRSDPDRHASNYRTQVINGFLGRMDSIAQEESVMVIGPCNTPEQMDPAVLLAGRMDIKMRVPLPDAQAIIAILPQHLSEDIADADLRELSHHAIGRSAADIDAAIRAARSDALHARKMLSLGMLHGRMGIELSEAENRVVWRVAVHEAGHAVAGAALGLGITESSAITSDGGQIERRGMPHESLLADWEAKITYPLASRAAERLIQSEISARAGGPSASDLALATRHAVEIETTFGLGHEGLVWHADAGAVHLRTPAIRDRVAGKALGKPSRGVEGDADQRNVPDRPICLDNTSIRPDLDVRNIRIQRQSRRRKGGNLRWTRARIHTDQQDCLGFGIEPVESTFRQKLISDPLGRERRRLSPDPA